jgi:hypothetical protein
LPAPVVAPARLSTPPPTTPGETLAPAVSDSGRTVETVRIGFHEGAPLFLVGAAFLSSAWAASVYHLRILASPYPMWILLVMNGAIIVAAGTVGLFVRESEHLPNDDPEMIQVPRARWESLLSRLEPLQTPVRPSPPIPIIPPAPASGRFVPTPRPTLPLRVPLTAPREPRRPARVSTQDTERTALRRGMGVLELHGIAEAVITTGEKLGGEELEALLEDSAVDLDHLSELLGAPARRNEPPVAILLRLLRLSQTMEGLPPGRFTAVDVEQLIVKLSTLNSVPNTLRRSRSPPSEVGAAADEFEALLRELAPGAAAPKRSDEARKNGRDAR